jgi:hypothetical protein
MASGGMMRKLVEVTHVALGGVVILVYAPE